MQCASNTVLSALWVFLHTPFALLQNLGGFPYFQGTHALYPITEGKAQKCSTESTHWVLCLRGFYLLSKGGNFRGGSK